MSEWTRPSASGARFDGLLISNLVHTDVKLGRGADATVYAVEWNGTVCAAKRLHDILLEDESPGGVDKLIGNFELECVTWSKLRHPGVVQFLGVYLDRRSRLPMLVLEKMDTSLRTHLETRGKDEFPLQLKVFVLRQVTQALAYLHNQNPPLVHHDLSPNNVLMNTDSFVTKVSDFGMSRVINPSNLTRKSSIKGTLAFMAPEALQNVPKYDTKLDVFSFGNIVISTLTHEWPNPGAPNQFQGNLLVALNELQRREQYIVMFTAQEKQIFLPTVSQCLENRPDERPSSATLVKDLRRIESSLPTGTHVPVQQLHQQLSAKEEECRQNMKVLKEKAKALREKDMALIAVLNEKAEMKKERDAALKEKYEALRDKDTALKEKEALERQLAAAQKVKQGLRDWGELGECQKVIRHSRSTGTGGYVAVAVNSKGLIAVTDGSNRCVHLLAEDGALVRSIGKGLLGELLCGVAFDVKENVWVTDFLNDQVVKLSQDGRLLQTIQYTGSESHRLRHPTCVSISPEGQMYICDNGHRLVTVHDAEGNFLFSFGAEGSGSAKFTPRDIAFGSDGLVYVTDNGNMKVCVWSKEGKFNGNFKTSNAPSCIAATSDNHLLITSWDSHTVMVYTLDGKLVHLFGGYGSDVYTGLFDRPQGICVDDSGLVYVVDQNERVQIF